jgi:hypothetical protein
MEFEMNNFDLWLIEIQKFEEGKIWFNNFEFDKRSGNLTAVTLSEIIKAFDSITLTFQGIADPKLLASALANDFWTAFEASSSSFDLRCERSPTGLCNWYSFAVPVQLFLEKYVCGKKPGDSSQRKYVPDWKLITRARNYIKKKEVKGFIKTKRMFFWATRTENYAQMRQQYTGRSDELAREIRIAAGLSHRCDGEGLIEMRIPAGSCSGKIIKAPSILDAGYPSGAFISSDDTKTGYGWTLNLATYTKGLDEVLIEELEYDENCDAEVIGVIPREGNARLDLSKLENISRTRQGF